MTGPTWEAVERCRSTFEGHDYSQGLDGLPQARLQALAAAIEWVLARQKAKADALTDAKAKKDELNHFQNMVSGLSTAFALASSGDYAQSVKEEVGFFQAVKAAMTKPSPKSGMSKRDKEFAVGQLISEAISDASNIDCFSRSRHEQP